MMPNICKDIQYFSGRSGPIILGNSLAVSYEARHKLVINSIIPLLGLYPKELKTLCPHNIFCKILVIALFLIARKEKQTYIHQQEH